MHTRAYDAVKKHRDIAAWLRFLADAVERLESARLERLESAIRIMATARHEHLSGGMLMPVLEAIDDAIAILPPDPPIHDPEARAEAVAKDLRRRGVWAVADGSWLVLPCLRNSDNRVLRQSIESTLTDLADRGPKAIADELQREEAKRIERWAGER